MILPALCVGCVPVVSKEVRCVCTRVYGCLQRMREKMRAWSERCLRVGTGDDDKRGRIESEGQGTIRANIKWIVQRDSAYYN